VLAWFLMALLMLVSEGCSQPPIEKSSRGITVLFEEFVYVGDRARDSVEEHSPRSATLPSRFDSSREYVFHHQLPVDAMLMGTETLPSRLRSLGFTITSAPYADSRGLFVTSNGELVYAIKAEQPGCELEIYHQLDKRLLEKALPWEYGRWERSDYVLKLQGVCGL
jgi:hypothetical protein